MKLAFAFALAVVLAAELFVSGGAHFPVEARFGFSAAYGFVACAVLIVVARALGLLLKRRDDYYREGDE